MRLRGQYKNYKRSKGGENIDNTTPMAENQVEEKTEKVKQVENEREPGGAKNIKAGTMSQPFKMIRQLMGNPNFNMQLMVILLSLTSDNIQMDRRIDGMTTTIEKVRNITELVNNGMQSMKAVSEVPKSIRRILE